MSIGSLGRGNNNDVSFVDIRNCSFVGTDNGLRIKTWAPSKQGTVSHVYVENIQMDQVKNPIVIDQNYCPARRCSATVRNYKPTTQCTPNYRCGIQCVSLRTDC